MKKMMMLCLAAGMCYLGLSVYTGKISLDSKVEAGQCAKYDAEYNCVLWA